MLLSGPFSSSVLRRFGISRFLCTLEAPETLLRGLGHLMLEDSNILVGN
jgi:hypothetical protein